MLGLLKFINGVYFITAERTMLEKLAKKHPVKEPKVDPSKLHWTPYLNGVKKISLVFIAKGTTAKFWETKEQ